MVFAVGQHVDALPVQVVGEVVEVGCGWESHVCDLVRSRGAGMLRASTLSKQLCFTHVGVLYQITTMQASDQAYFSWRHTLGSRRELQKATQVIHLTMYAENKINRNCIVVLLLLRESIITVCPNCVILYMCQCVCIQLCYCYHHVWQTYTSRQLGET